MHTNKYTRSLCIFRRDLRLQDHKALHAAFTLSQEVIPVFFLDPRQISKQNAYRSLHAMQFMFESLNDLAQQLTQHAGKLFYFHGQPEQLLPDLCKKYKIDAVFFNKDYTPFAHKRDSAIEKVCAKMNVRLYTYHDALLCNPEDVQTKSGSTYKMFTPFYKAASSLIIEEPQHMPSGSFYTGHLEHQLTSKDIEHLLKIEKTVHLATHGGTAQAKKLLHHLEQVKNYKNTHDIPSIDTSLLSAHLKFGTISVRQAYHAIAKTLGKEHPLIRQLYWRDFFGYTAFHYPEMFGSCLRSKYNTLHWINNKKWFERWQTGTTGFPIVDAGMRQLNTTGFMHNRVRMIVASFLVKDLHIDWRWGEQYFAQQLTDYDPAVNNGNWQWSASVGIDAQPYFRIFNPWTGQKKFDPDCLYIKRWVQELKNIPAKIIHHWHKTCKKVQNIGYPTPIVDHAKERTKSIALYKVVKLFDKQNPHT